MIISKVKTKKKIYVDNQIKVSFSSFFVFMFYELIEKQWKSFCGLLFYICFGFFFIYFLDGKLFIIIQRCVILPVKQPLALRAFAFNTGSIDFNEHGENRLLFFLSPDVALANIIKFPSSPPGVHCSGSCCKDKNYKINK